MVDMDLSDCAKDLFVEAVPLYSLGYRHNNQISIVIEPAPSLIHGRMRTALADLGLYS